LAPAEGDCLRLCRTGHHRGVSTVAGYFLLVRRWFTAGGTGLGFCSYHIEGAPVPRIWDRENQKIDREILVREVLVLYLERPLRQREFDGLGEGASDTAT